jgi:hypothetical protein
MKSVGEGLRQCSRGWWVPVAKLTKGRVTTPHFSEHPGDSLKWGAARRNEGLPPLGGPSKLGGICEILQYNIGGKGWDLESASPGFTFCLYHLKTLQPCRNCLPRLCPSFLVNKMEIIILPIIIVMKWNNGCKHSTNVSNMNSVFTTNPWC